MNEGFSGGSENISAVSYLGSALRDGLSTTAAWLAGDDHMANHMPPPTVLTSQGLLVSCDSGDVDAAGAQNSGHAWRLAADAQHVLSSESPLYDW